MYQSKKVRRKETAQDKIWQFVKGTKGIKIGRKRKWKRGQKNKWLSALRGIIGKTLRIGK